MDKNTLLQKLTPEQKRKLLDMYKQWTPEQKGRIENALKSYLQGWWNTSSKASTTGTMSKPVMTTQQNNTMGRQQQIKPLTNDQFNATFPKETWSTPFQWRPDLWLWGVPYSDNRPDLWVRREQSALIDQNARNQNQNQTLPPLTNEQFNADFNNQRVLWPAWTPAVRPPLTNGQFNADFNNQGSLWPAWTPAVREPLTNEQFNANMGNGQNLSLKTIPQNMLNTALQKLRWMDRASAEKLLNQIEQRWYNVSYLREQLGFPKM
jgi:hypothetical protein